MVKVPKKQKTKILPKLEYIQLIPALIATALVIVFLLFSIFRIIFGNSPDGNDFNPDGEDENKAKHVFIVRD